MSLRTLFRAVMSGTISAKNDVRFVFTPSCLLEDSCLIYVICACLLIVSVQHILRCVFCFVCLRLVCPMLSVLLDCQFLIAPSVFSNVYLSNDGQQFH